MCLLTNLTYTPTVIVLLFYFNEYLLYISLNGFLLFYNKLYINYFLYKLVMERGFNHFLGQLIGTKTTL